MSNRTNANKGTGNINKSSSPDIIKTEANNTIR